MIATFAVCLMVEHAFIHALIAMTVNLKIIVQGLNSAQGSGIL